MPLVTINGGLAGDIHITGHCNIGQATGIPYAYFAGGSADIDLVLRVEGGQVTIVSQSFTARGTAANYADPQGSTTGYGSGTVTAVMEG